MRLVEDGAVADAAALEAGYARLAQQLEMKKPDVAPSTVPEEPAKPASRAAKE